MAGGVSASGSRQSRAHASTSKTPLRSRSSGQVQPAASSPRPAKAKDGFVALKPASATRISAGEGLPSQAEARVKIQQVLPQLADAVAAITEDGRTINDATCNVAAGLALGKLRQMGLPAELCDANGHVTVRVKTADGKELIVDPTMPQFFKDGSSIDKELRRKGGFVGTKQELRQLLSRNVDHWAYKGDHTGMAESLKQARKDPGVDRSDLKQVEKMFLDETMGRLFQPSSGSSLADAAKKLAQRYESYLQKGAAATSSTFERTVFEFLRLH